MKFWQLMSVAGSEEGLEAIREVSQSQPHWRAFDLWRIDLAKLCKEQDRDKLDFPLPAEFCRAVLSRVTENFFLSGGQLSSKPLSAIDQELSALEAFDTYGADALEQALEFGSWPVGGFQ